MSEGGVATFTWGIRQVFLEKLAFEMCFEDGLHFKHELQAEKHMGAVTWEYMEGRGPRCCSDQSLEYIAGFHRLDGTRSNSVARLCVDMEVRYSSSKR